MNIIAICGFQGAGKDTLANILVEKYGYTKLSFAGILKDIVAIIFNWDRKLLEGDTIESRKWREQIDEWWSNRLCIKNLTPRYILQTIGTDVFRNHFHPDIWIASIEKKLSNYNKIVITDCRFPNEIDIIKKYGGKLIHIYRDKLPEWFINKNIVDGLHSSEYSWIKCSIDYTIENNGTIDDLSKLIDYTIKIV